VVKKLRLSGPSETRNSTTDFAAESKMPNPAPLPFIRFVSAQSVVKELHLMGPSETPEFNHRCHR